MPRRVKPKPRKPATAKAWAVKSEGDGLFLDTRGNVAVFTKKADARYFAASWVGNVIRVTISEDAK